MLVLAPFLEMLETKEEQDKFSVMYNLYKDMVLGIAYQLLRNHSFVEDSASDTFTYLATVFQKIGDVQSPQTKKYIAVVARGKAIDIFHKEYDNHRIDLDEAVLANIPDESYFCNIRAIELKMAMETLSKIDQQIVYLTYYKKYSSEQVGKMCGMRADNVLQCR